MSSSGIELVHLVKLSSSRKKIRLTSLRTNAIFLSKIAKAFKNDSKINLTRQFSRDLCEYS